MDNYSLFKFLMLIIFVCVCIEIFFDSLSGIKSKLHTKELNLVKKNILSKAELLIFLSSLVVPTQITSPRPRHGFTTQVNWKGQVIESEPWVPPESVENSTSRQEVKGSFS